MKPPPLAMDGLIDDLWPPSHQPFRLQPVRLLEPLRLQQEDHVTGGSQSLPLRTPLLLELVSRYNCPGTTPCQPGYPDEIIGVASEPI